MATAFGLSAASAGTRPVLAVLGDLAMYHGMNGLLASSRLGLRVTFVVVNNHGGGIFDHLEQAQVVPEFERYFIADHGLDFAKVADLYGLQHLRVENTSQLAAAIDRALKADLCTLVEVMVDRGQSLACRHQLNDAVHSWRRSAAGGAGPGSG